MASLQPLFDSLKSIYRQYLKALPPKYSKPIIVASGVFGFMVVRQLFWKIYFRIRGYPNGPLGLPFLGCALQFGLNPFHFLATLSSKYSVITYVPLMITNNYFISDPKILRELFQRQKINNRPPFQPVKTTPFAALNGKAWHLRRRYFMKTVMTLTNSSFVLQKILKTLENSIGPMIDEEYIKEKKLWFAKDHIQFIVFQNLWCCIFDQDLDFNDPFITEYIDAFRKAEESSGISVLFDTLLPFFGINEYLKDIFSYPATNKFNNVLLKWMNKNGFKVDPSRNILQRLDRNNNNNNNNVYVDVMIEKLNQKEISVASIISDIQTGAMAAALDTTSRSSELAFILLAKYPDIQQIIVDELLDIMDKHNLKQFDFSILNELHHLKAFIHEVLRMSTPLSFGVPHMVMNEDCKLEIDGKTIVIPKKSSLFSNIYYMHRFMDWNNGKTLKHDNQTVHLEYWLDENKKFKMNDNFVGFGVGKRNCAGQALAIRQMYAIFGLMIIKYKFVAANEIDIKQKFDFVLRIDPPIGIQIEKR